MLRFFVVKHMPRFCAALFFFFFFFWVSLFSFFSNLLLTFTRCSLKAGLVYGYVWMCLCVVAFYLLGFDTAIKFISLFCFMKDEQLCKQWTPLSCEGLRLFLKKRNWGVFFVRKDNFQHCLIEQSFEALSVSFISR